MSRVLCFWLNESDEETAKEITLAGVIDGLIAHGKYFELNVNDDYEVHSFQVFYGRKKVTA